MAYNYTKPRGPIAAMYSSPGPVYSLPPLIGRVDHDPRSVHYRAPAYPFGTVDKTNTTGCGPGPCYALESNLYVTGRDGAPKFSLYGRPKDLTMDVGPGPGAHNTESGTTLCMHRAPAYSLYGRHDNKTNDRTPGPDQYDAPDMRKPVESQKRRAPSYALAGRSKIGGFHEDLQKTPGPGVYPMTDTKVYKKRPPNYSITGRNNLPGDSTTKPGPGAHSAETVWVHKREPPRFSFGIRHSAYSVPFIVPEVAD